MQHGVKGLCGNQATMLPWGRMLSRRAAWSGIGSVGKGIPQPNACQVLWQLLDWGEGKDAGRARQPLPACEE